jgi:hypothetical protein
VTGITVKGVEAVQSHLSKIAQGVAGAKQKPVYVGTSLFYGRFQEEGTRRGVRATHYLERAAKSARSAAKTILAGKLESGDVMTGLVELARKVRTVASGAAPRERGKLRRSIKVQVGGSLRRSR